MGLAVARDRSLAGNLARAVQARVSVGGFSTSYSASCAKDLNRQAALRQEEWAASGPASIDCPPITLWGGYCPSTTPKGMLHSKGFCLIGNPKKTIFDPSGRVRV